jgi:UDP-N-acetylglucosamine:LPS N-acetylglucosamine transferase
MAISDLGIIKSGTVTYIEALYSNLPVLLDATTGMISWERFNHTYNKEEEFGDSIGRNREIYLLVNELLANPTILANIKKNIQTNKKKCLGREINSLVYELINK